MAAQAHPGKLVHAHYTFEKHEEGREPRTRIAWASITRLSDDWGVVEGRDKKTIMQ